MPDATTVRVAVEAEIDELGEMWRAMYAFQQERGMLLPLRDDAVEIWKRETQPRLASKLASVFVAQVTGERGLAGFISAQVRRLPPWLAGDNPMIGHVPAIYVRPEARRHQVGRALVAAAFAWFRAAGVGSVDLQVIATNDVAREFWTSVGFEPELLQMRARRI